MSTFTSSHPPAPLIQALRDASRVLIATHENPDGDAIGSTAALAHLALALGKDVRLYCVTEPPTQLSWLPLPAPLVSSFASLDGWSPDCLLVADCGDAHRAGPEMAAYCAACAGNGALPPGAPPACLTLSIDHHLGNPGFARHNWVDPGFCATGGMVAELAASLGVPLAGDLGEALYLALVSDTGSFSFSNTNAHALSLAAEIVRSGLSPADFTSKYENNWSIARMHLWGAAMSEVRMECGGSVVVSVVTGEHLERFNALPTDLENYASWLRRLEGVRVVLFARLREEGGSKISLRSMGDVDVRAVAAQFGGGGHRGAAGITMPQEPHEAARRVLEAVCLALQAC